MKVSEFDDFIFENSNDISICWTIGGRSGGSCWNVGKKNAHTSIETEEEPEFLELENVLNNFPDLKYSTYKKIKDLIKVKDFEDSGYYGNYTERRKKYIVLSDLKDILIEENCFEDEHSLNV